MKKVWTVIKDEGIGMGADKNEVQKILNELGNMSRSINKEKALELFNFEVKGFHLNKIDGIGENLKTEKQEMLSKYISAVEINYYGKGEELECIVDFELIRQYFGKEKIHHIDEDILNAVYPQWEFVSIFIEESQRNRMQSKILVRAVEKQLKDRNTFGKLLAAFEYEIKKRKMLSDYKFRLEDITYKVHK
ncbi:hypothetical protein AAGG74_15745 [Bacillus mexicanus]|uniref:hypothetical protein n=1 Tax=Bacillus mexicanus TaxID=2834415 RepID=UPI003D1B8FA1